MFNKKTVKDIDVNNKKVLVRVDFNVPIKDGVVGDDTRIVAALPTIKYLIENGASVILCSHLGRPKGKPDAKFSLEPVAKYLEKIINSPVIFVKDCIGEDAKLKSKGLKPGEIILLENTRFYPQEKENDKDFAEELASMADIYVNDAFGSSHRAHASTYGVAEYLPAVAGFLLEKEIEYLGNAIASPERPFVAILGGAKVSDKINVIKYLATQADKILIGGGMANTFFMAQGYPMGDSLVEHEVVDLAKELLDSAGDKLRLPVDVVVANKFEADADYKTIQMGPIDQGWRVLDIGEETVNNYNKVIAEAGTVVWNGPMGVFEFENFAKGTFSVAKSVSESNAVSIIGGGESVAAIKRSGLDGKITHISTGGGASLEMLEGKTLPGLAILNDKS